MNRWRGVIEEYRKFLPVTDGTPVVTLGEGNTPLIRATRLAEQIAKDTLDPKIRIVNELKIAKF